MTTFDEFIFNWFNERQPDEMKRCMDAYDELFRDTDGSPKGPDPQGLDGEAATAGARRASPRLPQGGHSD